MSFLLLVGFALAQDPFAYVTEKGAYLISLAKSKQYDDIARMFHPNALILPPNMPNDFVTHEQIPDFLAQIMKHNSNDTFVTVPSRMEAQDGMLHELGTFQYNGTESKYYNQWIRDELQGWVISLRTLLPYKRKDEPSSDQLFWNEPKSGPTDILAKLYKSFVDQFNGGDIPGAVTSSVTEDFRLLNAAGDSIYSSAQAIRLATTSSMIPEPKSFTPLYVHEESDMVWHEIGHRQVGTKDKTYDMFYYSRWERESSSDQWKVALHLGNIGAK